MHKSRYDGLMLENRWKFKKNTKNGTLMFENIFNGNSICISKKQLESVISGKTTVGHIMTRRIKTKPHWITNNVVRDYNTQRRHYAKGGK